MINGVPYPIDVNDEATLRAWISSIDREIGHSTTSSALAASFSSEKPPVDGHLEIYHMAYFNNSVVGSKQFAKSLVCRNMAMKLFCHLIFAPKAKLVWRCEPEFDVSQGSIPADLSMRMTRQEIDAALALPDVKRPMSLDVAKKALGKSDWAIDFCTDSIFEAVAPKGEWCLFKAYARYSVVLDDKVIQPPWSAAA